MNWEAIAAIAESLGALGVILSLVYLATQIRQNTQSVRMSSHHGMAQEFNHLSLALVQDPEVVDLVSRGVVDPASLSDAERDRFYGYISTLFRVWEELFQLDRKGLADPELWQARQRGMRRWLGLPGVQSWWHNAFPGPEMFVDSFRALVEEELKRLDSTAT